MDIKFDDFVINKSDYDFFKSLSKSEKLMFLHDLLCDQEYGIGSTPETVLGEPVSLKERMNYLVDSVTDIALDFNILVVNSFVVINAKTENSIQAAANDLFMSGYILYKRIFGENTRKIFQRQKHLAVYEILGATNYISEN